MSTGLSLYPEHLVEARADALRTTFYDLMDNDDFINSITYGTNGMKQVRHRFEVAGKMFKEVFDAESA